MIVFDLRCDNDHVFEAWFADSESFGEQHTAGEILCPICGDDHIEKAPMAPAVSTTKGREAAESRSTFGAGEAMRALADLRRQVEESCEYVGDKFADEARKIHYSERDKRDIYGQATMEEAESLQDEGVDFHQIPWLPRHDA